jgi:hypothetical protein
METAIYDATGDLVGATETMDTCPNDQVLVGFIGQKALYDPSDPTTYVLSEIQAVCGVLAISGGAVVVNPGTLLPVRASSPGIAWAAECPANQVVVGFAGHCGYLFDRLDVECAPILPKQGTPPTLESPVTTLPAVGGPGGNAFGPFSCPPGEVATMADIQVTAGNQGATLPVDLRLGCSTLTLTF